MKEGYGFRKESAPQVRVIVEVDGNPIGSVELDVDRLWPLIQPKDGKAPGEWIDPARFDAMVKAAVVRRLLERLERHLYKTLGDEIVAAKLEVESLLLRAEGAAQAFGRTRAERDAMLVESGRTADEFDAFFWDYLLSESNPADIRKQWKSARTRP